MVSTEEESHQKGGLFRSSPRLHSPDDSVPTEGPKTGDLISEDSTDPRWGEKTRAFPNETHTTVVRKTDLEKSITLKP